MKREFIPYKYCVKLWELGFSEDSFDCYWSARTGSGFNTHRYKIPKILYQQAFQWFREKGYDSYIEVTAQDFTTSYRGRVLKIEGNSRIIRSDTEPCHTYREAELRCLEELIRLADISLEFRNVSKGIIKEWKTKS